MTPMQEQYYKIKEEYKDFVILFRLGDFYEAFDDDAVTLSKVLGITLTGRGKDDNRKPMAGIPYHALKNYLPKLIAEGIKVAIADQMEEATTGKIVERQITKVITPGTVMDENSLDNSKNNFIAAVLNDKGVYNFGYADVTTGELNFVCNLNEKTFGNELHKIWAKEVLVAESEMKTKLSFLNTHFEILEKLDLDYSKNLLKLKEHFKVQNLKSFGIDEENKSNVNVLGMLLNYIEKTQRTSLKHFLNINVLNVSEYMTLDPETVRNLELIYSANGSTHNTLYSKLNECKTSMGKRLLQSWILHPLLNANLIQERLKLVENFYNNPRISAEASELLNQISDIQRICGRIGVNTAHPKDLLGLKYSLTNCLQIIDTLTQSAGSINQELINFLDKNSANLQNIQNVIQIIEDSISEEAPAIVNEGNIFKDGFNFELDELRGIKNNSHGILAEIQRREVERTGISTLKISFNSVFGYYIEITKSHLSKAPTDYIRKQTLANAERFITPELKELEDKILTAEDKIVKLEFTLFDGIRQQISQFIPDLLVLSNLIAQIDIFNSFGFLARQNEYSVPAISTTKRLKISSGRHPIIESIVGKFTPNDSEFDTNGNIHILTGPNMSGKSTYIRQVAVIALMAQIGSFVPAQNFEFKPFDRIFTRVGASDNLSKGESTFMVEMTETANILNNATADSLIILDEVGRGTSTYDGVAIAWSIIEYINSTLKSFTLFATHYHELIALADQYSNIKNFNVQVSENNGEIVFKHKIIAGGTNRSYGIHVAKLAGLPADVIKKADDILKSFEGTNHNEQTENQKSSLSEVNAETDAKTNKKSNSISKKPSKPKRIHPEQLGLI